jgi:L-ascorbate metabolism protein UlaG (beta-lactamase superfamily)
MLGQRRDEPPERRSVTGRSWPRTRDGQAARLAALVMLRGSPGFASSATPHSRSSSAAPAPRRPDTRRGRYGAADPEHAERATQPARRPPRCPADLVAAADAVVVTHLHWDHFDETAARLVGEAGLRVLCQPGDGAKLRERGVVDVTEVSPTATHNGVELHRTGGRRGQGELAEQMGAVSGFVLRARGEPSIYVAGDTVWCDEVEAALAEHRPDVVVVNAGAATFTGAPPIVMDSADVVRVADAAPDALVVAVHLEAVNHCIEGGRRCARWSRARRVAVPEDGETMAFTRRPTGRGKLSVTTRRPSTR